MKSISSSLVALLLLITRKAVAAVIGNSNSNSNSNSYNVPLFTLDELRNMHDCQPFWPRRAY
jgi:hypothetical protein